jgi:hypothetical protein
MCDIKFKFLCNCGVSDMFVTWRRVGLVKNFLAGHYPDRLAVVVQFHGHQARQTFRYPGSFVKVADYVRGMLNSTDSD